MNRIDHAVIGGLVLLLGVIAVVIGAPAFVPAAAHPTPTPPPAEVVPYREGVLGPVVSVNPPGARWHDGEPVTADDVVYTIQTLRDPAYAGPGAGSWPEVTATAVDARTV